ncbi:MAG: A/G-specific adenine glycosylase [Candidatus Pacebacteria bacterium]|nr:A/G-specific adenine glycosylase [Candidatus Paceibacterota bacterium]
MRNRVLLKKEILDFQNKIWKFYNSYKRSLSWRKTKNPYKILVSEIMLQQTQAERVLPKYTAFIKKFPTIHVLANASNTEVLRMWSGLGYNNRALRLRRTAKIVVETYGGCIPVSLTDLVALPGIGTYTAGAIRVFAFNAPEILIETNIRTVFIEEFFRSSKTKISDKEILQLIQLVLPKENFRDWYNALMDYGAVLKKSGISHNNKSKNMSTTYKIFAGSLRQTRGAIIKALLQRDMTEQELTHDIDVSGEKITRALSALVKDKIIVCKKNIYTIQQEI